MAPTASGTPVAESNPGAEYSDMNFDCMFKILLIGNSGVGKTSFLLQVCKVKFLKVAECILLVP